MSAGDKSEYVKSVAPDASSCSVSLVMSCNCGPKCSRLVIRCSGIIDGSNRRAMRRVGTRRRGGDCRACGSAYSRFRRLQAALCARLRAAPPPPHRAGTDKLHFLHSETTHTLPDGHRFGATPRPRWQASVVLACHPRANLLQTATRDGGPSIVRIGVAQLPLGLLSTLNRLHTDHDPERLDCW